MASPLLDFRKFKHVKTEGDSTLLKHQDGHELKIAHKALSKANKAQLDALSKLPAQDETPLQTKEAKYKDGGGVLSTIEDTLSKVGKAIDPSQKDEPKKEDLPPTPLNEDRAKGIADYFRGKDKEACGGMVKYAEGTTKVEQGELSKYLDEMKYPEKPEDSIDEESIKGGAGDVLNLGPTPEKAAIIDKVDLGPAPTEVPAIADKSRQTVSPQQEIEQSNSLLNPNQQPATSISSAEPEVAPVTPKPEMPASPTQAAPGDMQGMLEKAYKERQAGEAAKATALGTLGEEQAKIHNEQAAAQHLAITNFQTANKELNDERLAHIQDIKAGYINPEKYWDNHSKLATGIGMILAGFNPTGNPNAATEFLKHQMDQNIQAQAKNLSAKENLLTANLKQFGNLRDAADMTRVMQADYVSQQLQEAAAKAQSPLAKAAALSEAGKINQEFAPLFMQLSMRRAMMNLANSPEGAAPNAVEQMLAQMRAMGNTEGAKELASRYVPGYKGLSPEPVPEKVREELIAKAQLDAAAKDLYSWAEKHTGSLNPKDINVGKQKAALLQSLYRHGVLNTVYREGEQPLLDKVVNSDPTSFFNHLSTLPKLKEIIHGNDMGRNVLAQQYKITPPKSEGMPEIKKFNGASYQKVNGGWKKVQQ